MYLCETITNNAMTQQQIDEQYMRRCLQLAVCGRQNAKPNPMVGAVIVSSNGRIIGEGYHARFGEGHAEVNAFASVRPEDEHLLPEATVYVSLEPCSHYGKTPPCADLIVSKGVRRVVCGCIDPFAKVQGRGVKKMREAGIEVTVGVLEEECRALNKRFITFNTLHRPYILLKWAQTANGIMGYGDKTDKHLMVSTPFTQMLVHRLRADYDAIVVGRRTLELDHPQLTVREWSGKSPVRIVLSRSNIQVPDGFRRFASASEMLQWLYSEQKQSVMIEGGAEVLKCFLNAGLWDELRVETAPWTVSEGIPAPALPANIMLEKREETDGNIISTFVPSCRK